MTKFSLRSRLGAASLGALLLLACNTSEPPKAEANPTPAQPPTQVVAATAPITAAPVAPQAPAASAEPAAAGNSPAAPTQGGGHAPAAAANAPAAGATRGPAASNDTYTTWLESVGSYTAGQAGQVRLVLEAKAPYHTNEEYPYKFTFGSPIGGVSYPTSVVKDMKIAEMTASMTLPIQAAAKGAATVQGTFNFSVCSKDKCLIEKANLTLPIEIK
jgi:hypothetical protein